MPIQQIDWNNLGPGLGEVFQNAFHKSVMDNLMEQLKNHQVQKSNITLPYLKPSLEQELQTQILGNKLNNLRMPFVQPELKGKLDELASRIAEQKSITNQKNITSQYYPKIMESELARNSAITEQNKALTLSQQQINNLRESLIKNPNSSLANMFGKSVGIPGIGNYGRQLTSREIQKQPFMDEEGNIRKPIEASTKSKFESASESAKRVISDMSDVAKDLSHYQGISGQIKLAKDTVSDSMGIPTEEFLKYGDARKRLQSSADALIKVFGLNSTDKARDFVLKILSPVNRLESPKKYEYELRSQLKLLEQRAKAYDDAILKGKIISKSDRELFDPNYSNNSYKNEINESDGIPRLPISENQKQKIRNKIEYSEDSIVNTMKETGASREEILNAIKRANGEA